jgi:hypothetical protein
LGACTGDGGAVDATLAVTVNGIASDLADGALDGGPSIPTGDDLDALQATIDADAVMALLAQRFADISSDAVVPDLHRVFDLDPDVHPGAPESWCDGVDADCDGARDFLPAAANVEYTGESVANFTGSSVAGAGDMNCDGYDDLLVGSYNQEGGEGSGAAYIVLGSASPASASLSTAAAKLVGQEGDWAYLR